MTVFEYLSQKNRWIEFYEYKVNSGHMSESDMDDLWRFINDEEYTLFTDYIKQKKPFPYPKQIILNKKNTGKKRIVFSFDREENYILKYLSYLLLKYDTLMTPNLYSFRKNTGVKKAIADLTSSCNIDFMYSYKVDIHDYFNSVDINLLLPKLKKLLSDDPDLYCFLEDLLSNPYVLKNQELIQTKKGIMAGLPISPFLANIYLKELDEYFYGNNILYARYSDDIIFFAESAEELQNHIHTTLAILERLHLEVNPLKVFQTSPGEKWEFLGFSYQNGVIDVSEVALQKLKGKLKRKARSIYRWKTTHDKCDTYALRAYIKYFNRKFFDNPVHNEITWCRWYFPIINTDTTLHIIDQYTQNCIRYLTTGKYTKSNYNLRYETMKELGYRSLVHEYYKQK